MFLIMETEKRKIIDFHAHIYPEKIAEKAVKSIGDFYGIDMTSRGTAGSLVENGGRIGVVKYIVHSTATKPQQVVSINNYIIGEVKAERRFVGFGTLHPEFAETEAEVKRIREAGLFGIKLHPDFQAFQVDSPAMDPIYDIVAHYKMPVLFHAGDIRYDYSGPKRIAHVLDKHPDLTVIAAHFGGYTQWDDAFEYLAGRDLWFDTSSTLWKLPAKDALRIIGKHGYERFLFGSDFPMWDHESELERIFALKLPENELEAILFENGARLLKSIGCEA